ncbi:hypothetical protein BH20ACT6_BH20ACT6_19680 [soil metagenome]
MRLHSKNSKMAAGLAAAVLLGLPLAGCGSDDTAAADEPSSNSATPEPVAEVEALSGESTAVALDAGFVEALESLKLTPGVVGGAELTKKGSLVFPISGGDVTYYEPGSIDPYVQGMIEHDGSGFSLTAGKTTVKLTDFTVDPGTSQLFGDVAVNGKSAAKDAFLFALDGRTLKPLQTGSGDTAILEGTKVKISEDAAPLLNDTFGTDAIKPGLLVGIATITINTK